MTNLRHAVLPVVSALVAASLLAAVAMVAPRQKERTVRQEAFAQVQADADAGARSLVTQIDDYVRAARASGLSPGVIAALDAPRTRSAADVGALLRTLAMGRGSPVALLSDLRGRIVAVHPREPALIGRSLAFRDWYLGVSTTWRPYLSSGYRSFAAGHPLAIAVAVPVGEARRRLGYLVVLWRLASIRAVAEEAHLDDDVTITVADQLGQPLDTSLRLDRRGQPESTSVSASSLLALDEVDAEQDEQIVAVRPVTGVGWTVTAALPESIAMAPVAAFRSRLLAALGVAALVLLVGLGLGLRRADSRARDRAAVAAHAERLTGLFAASPIGIIEAHADGTILDVNDVFARMLDYTVEDLLAMRTQDLADPVSSPVVATSLEDVRGGVTSSTMAERTYRTRSGSPVPVLVSVVAIRVEGDSLNRLVSFVVDLRRDKDKDDPLKALSDALAQGETFLQTLLDTIDVEVLACDRDGALVRVNDTARAMHGLADDEVLPELTRLRFAHVDGSRMMPEETPVVRALTEGLVSGVEMLVLGDDGAPAVRLRSQARRLEDGDGSSLGAVSSAYDVTALRETEAALRLSEDRFRRVFDESVDGKALADACGVILRANNALASLLGVEARELRGRALAGYLMERADQMRVEDMVAHQGEGRIRGEMSLRGPARSVLWGRVALDWIVEPGGRMVLLAQVEDVTARRVAEQRLTEMALHDDLTGLPNRHLLMERLEQAFAVARSGRTHTGVAAFFIDLDGFKAVNDRAGHQVGDDVLKAVAVDLSAVLRPSDTLARVGGDEFVALLGQDEGLASVRRVADRVVGCVRRQVGLDGTSLVVSASVGIARVDLRLEPDVDPEQLLRRADAAMYSAKYHGRDRHRVFDDELLARTEQRFELEQTVREALLKNRIALVFQPVVDIDTGRILGAEAMMHLSDGSGILVPTLPAVTAAEQAGLAGAVGERVLHLALEALSRWPRHLTAAVNISPYELTGDDYPQRVEKALRRHGIDPTRLVLEVTESSMLGTGPASVDALRELRALGVRVAVEGFGTAYATLRNLTVLPVDLLKVDSSFTAGLSRDQAATAVVHGVVTMAREMSLPCIVEGVDTETQLRSLRGLAVQGQGRIWGQSLPGNVTPWIPTPRTP